MATSVRECRVAQHRIHHLFCLSLLPLMIQRGHPVAPRKPSEVDRTAYLKDKKQNAMIDGPNLPRTRVVRVCNGLRVNGHVNKTKPRASAMLSHEAFKEDWAHIETSPTVQTEGDNAQSQMSNAARPKLVSHDMQSFQRKGLRLAPSRVEGNN